MKYLTAIVLSLAATAAGAKELKSQLQQSVLQKKVALMARGALIQHYVKTWDDQVLLGYQPSDATKDLNISFEAARCLDAETEGLGVCLLEIPFDPYNGIEKAELVVTFLLDGEIDLKLLTHKSGPRLE